MLRNFINDDDLKKYHPLLNKQLWSTETSYGNQIDEAFHIVFTDLNNRGVNPRGTMIPFDLVSSGVTANLASPVSLTTSTTGSGMQAGAHGRNYHRLVVDAGSVSGTWSLQLQGSNDGSGWENVSNTTITVSDVGEQSIVFDRQYKWWRYVATGSGSITTSAYLVENIWDRLIIYKAFEIILSDFREAPNDSFDLLVKSYERRYDNELTSLKYLFDQDDNGVIQDTEETSSNYQFIL